MRLSSRDFARSLKKLTVTGGPPESEVTRWLALIQEGKKQNRSFVVGYINAFALNLASDNETFMALLQKQHHAICDGFGAKICLDVALHIKVERLTYADFLPLFLKQAEDNCLRLALIGYSPEQLTQIQQRLTEQFPKLNVVLFQNGFTSIEEQTLFFADCQAQQIDALLIGTGMPKQERMAEDAAQARAAFGVFPCGAAVLYSTGLQTRGPKWMTSSGFEWLWRLFCEPRRLWQRTLTANFYVARFIFARAFDKTLPTSTK